MVMVGIVVSETRNCGDDLNSCCRDGIGAEEIMFREMAYQTFAPEKQRKRLDYSCLSRVVCANENSEIVEQNRSVLDAAKAVYVYSNYLHCSCPHENNSI